jgi:trk system potassium uptake protein TrkH
LTIEKGNVASRIGVISKIMLVLYGGASLAVFAGFSLVEVDLYTAVLLTMGSISTGGFVPSSTSFSAAAGPIGTWVGIAGMIFGCMGFALHWDVLKRRASYLKDVETTGLFALFIGAGFLFLTLGHPIAQSFQNAISLISTTAIPIGETGFREIPTPIVMALVLIGGAAISTAGGVKIIRFLILFRQTGTDLALLSHPSSSQSIRFGQMVIEPFEMVGLWAYVLGYAAVISFLVIFLGAGGFEFAEASGIAIAAISNAGPSYIPASGLAGDFTALSNPMVLGLSFAMILGRIEILAAVAILSPEFWRE